MYKLEKRVSHSLVFSTPARKLVELANAVEVAQDDRIHIEKTTPPLIAGGAKLY
jgi:hypothetical protein